MVDFRAKLSQSHARLRCCALASLATALLAGPLGACGDDGEETPFRERPAYREFQEQCQTTSPACGPEGLCAPRCTEGDVGQGCPLSCEPHHCLSNDWTHSACLKCCAGEAHAVPDALSRCQRKCGVLYQL